MAYHFYVIGCGGTGSLLARDLPKLFTNTQMEMTIVDGDIVEKKNIIRQSYQQQDVGENKAVVLSKKINSLYDVKTYAEDKYLTKNELRLIIDRNKTKTPVIIGCVDNDKTRKLIEKTFIQLENVVYIDSANGEYEGNIFITYKQKGKQFGKLRSEAYTLVDDTHPLDQSCEIQVAKGNVQFLVTNAKMAVGILEHCNLLLEGNLKEGVQIVKRFETVFY